MTTGRMEEVELLEEGAPEPGTPAARPDGPDRFRALVRRALAWSRAQWPVTVPAAAVLALAVAVPAGLAARDEQARIAALGDHPGVLRPLDPSLHVAWTSNAFSD